MNNLITNEKEIRSLYGGEAIVYRSQSMWSGKPINKETKMNEENTKLSRSQKEQERIETIKFIGEKQGLESLALNAIADKTPVDEFRKIALKAVCDKQGDFIAPRYNATPAVHTSAHNYDYADAIRQASSGKLEGLVAEYNAEMKRTKGEGRSTRSIYIPSMFETRVLGDSAPIIPTQVSNYEKFLAKSGLAQQLGARIFNIDSAQVKVPVITALPSASVLALDGSASFSASDSTLGSATFVPKTFGALSEYSRELLMQSNQAESIIRDSLMQSVARKVDEVMLDGSGSGAEAVGLGNDSDILQVTYANGTDLDFDALRDGVEALQNIDYPVNGVKMVVNPSDYKALINTERGGSGSGSFVFEPNLQSDGSVASYLGIPVYVSKFLDAGKCVLGHFDKFGIGQFSGMELLADEVIESGKLQVRIFYDADMHVLDNNAFVRITEA